MRRFSVAPSSLRALESGDEGEDDGWRYTHDEPAIGFWRDTEK
jgi:hypothetical protein